MPKSPAERKAAQRARTAAAGMHKLEIHLSDAEMEMLRRNCALRRPGRDPYGADEYVELLLLQDNAALQLQLEKLKQGKCLKCGEELTVSDCCHKGEAACWVTMGWHQTKLRI